jgi:glutamate N-acetyltransferase/amino-acid N-acetyltransferase
MTTLPQGFRASAVAAGLKSSGALDLALLVNEGPIRYASAVFTKNRVEAAPVTWSRSAVSDHRIDAILLNSGGANACTGPEGFALTHRCAEQVAHSINSSASDVMICSTGMIGIPLPEAKIVKGIEQAVSGLSDGDVEAIARAIMTTDSVPKIVERGGEGWRIVGIAKGAGMLAPALATMLVVIMTDAIIETETLGEISARTFERIDSDGCTSTNDTVALLASGSSGVMPRKDLFDELLQEVCAELSLKLIEDAEGHTKVVAISTIGAASEADAVAIGRAVARNNLLKCAITGEDPNWGRILAAIGTTHAVFDPARISVSINGVEVCRDSAPFLARERVDMTGKNVLIEINLGIGMKNATVHTNDLSPQYVHENSAYST